MRISIFGFGFEINSLRRPTRADSTVWHRPPHYPVRLGDLTPAQLRDILAEIRQHITAGGTLHANTLDKFQRVHFADQWPPAPRSFSAVVERISRRTETPGEFKTHQVDNPDVAGR